MSSVKWIFVLDYSQGNTFALVHATVCPRILIQPPCHMLETSIAGTCCFLDGEFKFKLFVRNVQGKFEHQPDFFSPGMKLDELLSIPNSLWLDEREQVAITSADLCSGSDGVSFTEGYFGIGKQLRRVPLALAA